MKKTTTISRLPIARTGVGSLRGFRASALAVAVMLFTGSAFVKPVAAQLLLNPGILVADFNHDGIPDALVPSPDTSSFTLSFGSVPFGTFSPVARSVAYPASCASIIQGAVVVADFNGDGIPDLALACNGSPTTGVAYQVYVMLGAGDGSFVTKSSFAGQIDLLAGDFDKDGKVDLVTAGSNGTGSAQAIVLMKGNGDGTFTVGGTTPIASIVYPAALSADLNADGYPDVVLGNFGGQAALTMEVYGNNQNGTFGTPATTYAPSATIPVGTYPDSADQAIIVGNFYGSGLPDLAVVDRGGTPGVFVIKNNSMDGFAFADPAKTAYPALVAATAAPFTSTLSDLLVYDGAKLAVLANDGTGTFAASYAALSVPSTSGVFAAADANGDGHADIYSAAVTATGASLSVDLVSGSASAKSTAFALPTGTIPVAASWPGNINFIGASLTGSQVVNGLATTISLASSKNPSALGDSVTFTTTVAPATSGNHILSGTVTFLDGTATLGTGTVGTGGVATFTTTALAAGSRNITAAYSGDDFFAAATVAVPLVQQVTDLTLSSFTPNTAQLGDPAKTITVTGSGIAATTVVQVNGTAIATTIVNATTLTAVIPASYFVTAGTLQITLSNPATGSVTTALAFTVTAPTVSGTLTGPPTAPPGTQPVLTFTLLPYPVDVVATLTLTQKSSLPSGVTDPRVMFSGADGITLTNNGQTASFVIAAGSTSTPTLAFQAGTVAEVITVVPVLTVNGVDVTPDGLAPAVIDVPAAVPAATATTLTRDGDQLVVTFAGYSNTREIVGAKFHFVAANGETIETTDFTPPVADLFTTWYANPDSQKEGSSFTYTQNFTINNGADKIASVQIILTNTIGDSTMETAQ